MAIANEQWQWRPTTAQSAVRHDDIWFLDANIGWAVNSDGKIIKTTDGGITWQVKLQTEANVYLRSMGFANVQMGWVGTLDANNRLFATRDGGETWNSVENLPDFAPPAICGLYVVNESVIYGSGTNFPDRPTGIIKSVDGGKNWVGIDMRSHATLLVDIYFKDVDHGWVVGGKSDVQNPTRDDVKPIVLQTKDGGTTWKPTVIQSDLPLGEWGWKIFFVNESIGFVSLENFNAGAILKTIDGGQTWTRKEVNDLQGNANLEGLGFFDENRGWVGGWGDRNFSGGYSSATLDGGNNWQNANEIGRFINRFRFIGNPITVGYASGDTIYKYSKEPITETFEVSPLEDRILCADIPLETERPVKVTYKVDENVRNLSINIWDRFGDHVCNLISQQNPEPGVCTKQWDCKNDSMESLPSGYYILRITIDNKAESRIFRVKN